CETPKSNVTLIGDGSSLTIFRCQSASACLQVGPGTLYGQSGVAVTSSTPKGTTNLTLADASSFSVNQLVQLRSQNDYTVPVLATSGFPYMRNQVVQVTGKSNNTITISPALYNDY